MEKLKTLAKNLKAQQRNLIEYTAESTRTPPTHVIRAIAEHEMAIIAVETLIQEQVAQKPTPNHLAITPAQHKTPAEPPKIETEEETWAAAAPKPTPKTPKPKKPKMEKEETPPVTAEE